MTDCNESSAWVGASAEFCPMGCHRYSLGRRLTFNPRGQHCVFVLLNPSTADARKDDPTVRRCVGFADRWGCATVEIVNLYSLATPDPDVLTRLNLAGTIGIGNHDVILRAAERADIIVAGWGAHRAVRKREQTVCSLIRQARRNAALSRGCELSPLKALGLTQAGHPRHPLYLRADSRRVLYHGPNAGLEAYEGRRA